MIFKYIIIEISPFIIFIFLPSNFISICWLQICEVEHSLSNFKSMVKNNDIKTTPNLEGPKLMQRRANTRNHKIWKGNFRWNLRHKYLVE